MHTNFWLENLKGQDHTEDIGIDKKIILEWILGDLGGKVWTRCIWLRIGTSGSSCEHDNEPSTFIKGRDFIDYLSDY
jgi:hypothetical protein